MVAAGGLGKLFPLAVGHLVLADGERRHLHLMHRLLHGRTGGIAHHELAAGQGNHLGFDGLDLWPDIFVVQLGSTRGQGRHSNDGKQTQGDESPQGNTSHCQSSFPAPGVLLAGCLVPLLRAGPIR